MLREHMPAQTYRPFFVMQVTMETYNKKKKCNKIKGLEAQGALQ